MTLEEILRVVRLRWRVVVAAALIGILAGALLFVLRPEQYTASTTLYVAARTDNTTTSAYQGNLLTQQRVKSYTELATSPRVALAVKEALRLPEDVNQIAEHLSATSRTDSVIIDLSATSDNPELASDSANIAAQAFTSLVAELESPATPGQAPQVFVREVQRASPPETPSSIGVTTSIGIGLIGGVVLGLLFALAWDRLDRTVGSTDDLVKIVHRPNLGIVRDDRGAEASYLPVMRAPRGANAEAFRQIRTNLRFVSVDAPPKTILVTSALPGEGKSTVSSNLALAMASMEENVLLIDSDLRRPRIAGLFDLENSTGLTSVLAGHVHAQQVLQKVNGFPRLDVLTAGRTPPNPSELLGSQHMSNLLATLKHNYSFIVIDSPPILSVADATVLGPNCDGVMLVCQAKKTRREALSQASESLSKVSANLLGTVLTRIQNSSADQYYRYDDKYLNDSPSNADETDMLNGRTLLERDAPQSRPVPHRRSIGPQ